MRLLCEKDLHVGVTYAMSFVHCEKDNRDMSRAGPGRNDCEVHPLQPCLSFLTFLPHAQFHRDTGRSPGSDS